MNQIVSTGIILGRIDYAEADRIITILTPDHGKIRLIAKGVRRIKSKLAGGIELFSISQITYISGRGEIGTLISSRLQKYFGKIVQDIDRTMFGYEVLKMINKVTEDMAGEEYFQLLSNLLLALDDSEVGLVSLRLWFQMQLLKLAGHSPNLLSDTQGDKLAGDKYYNFDLEDMTFAVSETGRYSASHIKLLRLSIGLDSPLRLKQVTGVDDVLPACQALVTTMLQQYMRI